MCASGPNTLGRKVDCLGKQASPQSGLNPSSFEALNPQKHEKIGKISGALVLCLTVKHHETQPNHTFCMSAHLYHTKHMV